MVRHNRYDAPPTKSLHECFSPTNAFLAAGMPGSPCSPFCPLLSTFRLSPFRLPLLQLWTETDLENWPEGRIFQLLPSIYTSLLVVVGSLLNLIGSLHRVSFNNGWRFPSNGTPLFLPRSFCHGSHDQLSPMESQCHGPIGVSGDSGDYARPCIFWNYIQCSSICSSLRSCLCSSLQRHGGYHFGYDLGEGGYFLGIRSVRTNFIPLLETSRSLLLCWLFCLWPFGDIQTNIEARSF